MLLHNQVMFITEQYNAVSALSKLVVASGSYELSKPAGSVVNCRYYIITMNISAGAAKLGDLIVHTQ